jgi:hypothetical protein
MGLSSVFSLLGFDHNACLLHVHHEQTVITGISNHPRNNSMSECHVIQFFIYIFLLEWVLLISYLKFIQ